MLPGCAVTDGTRESRGRAATAAIVALPIVRPPRLSRGDVVGLFAPSTLVNDGHVARAIANMTALGLTPRLPRHLRAVFGGWAGSVEQRVDDFHTLWRDPEVKALWAVRGGSSAAGMLPLLDHALLRREPKIVIGYSDITALLLGIRRRAGLVTFHGPVAVSTFSEFTLNAVRSVLMDPRPEAAFLLSNEHRRRAVAEPQFRARTIRPGRAEGRLVGGNLAVLSALVGTPYAADLEGALLFLEEVREAPYRIDRMLTQLDQSQGLARTAGLIAGVFERCEPPDSDPSLSLAETIDLHFAAAGVPAVYGWSFGHVAPQLTLPLGVRARLDTASETLTLLEPAVA